MSKIKLWKLPVVVLITGISIIGYGGSCNIEGSGSSGSSGSITLSTPSVITNPATGITQTTATLNGTVNPNGVGIFVYFQFGTSIGYSSTTNYQDIGSGISPVNVSANLSGLSTNTTYNFRIIATRGSGTGIAYNGTNQTFTTTVGLPPTCVTNAATNITSNSARLNGTVNPNGGATDVYFNYGLTTSYGNTTTSETIGSGASNVAVITDINGLSVSTQYNFRVFGVNSNGTTNGNNLTFTTGNSSGSAPTCTTDAADNITSNSARLNGTVNPNGLAATAYFQWGTTASYGSSTTAQAIGSGTSNVAVLADIDGLSSNTVYNFRCVATNNRGTTYGNNLTFTTGNSSGSAPTCTTDAADNITFNSAKLNGTVNPNEIDTTAYFQWGTTTSYGSSTTAQTIGSGTVNIVVSATISSLTPNTLYNFRVVGVNSNGTTYGNNLTFSSVKSNLYNFRCVATNSSGTTYGNNLTFSTAAPPTPICTTNAATNVSYNSATLNGTVNPNGFAATAYFQWGTTTSYGNSTTGQAIPAGGTSIAVSADISGLLLITQYNFRVVCFNSYGTYYGNNLIFPTGNSPGSAPTCTTDAATNVYYPSTARLNGTVNPNGVTTNGYFNYGLTTSYGSSTTAQAIGNGTSNVPIYADISGLSPNIYSFRVVGVNASGTTYGDSRQFSLIPPPPPPLALVPPPPPRPICTTKLATNITIDSGRLNGTVNPNGLNVTSCYFDYGTTLSYGSQATASPSPGSGTSNVSVNADISGLSGNTLYNFRVVGVNSNGTNYGNNLTFTTGNTSGSAPTCTTEVADNITYNSARLNGTVIPNGLATTVYFNYGLTTSSYTFTTTAPAIPAGGTSVAVTVDISGL